jgi:pyruvate kinase
MKLKKKKIVEMLAILDQIIKRSKENESNFIETINKIDPVYKKSAINFLHYLAFREKDLRDLQLKLGELGFSKLANAESNVINSVYSVRNLLRRLNKQKKEPKPKGILTKKKAAKLLREHTNLLLGKKLKDAKTRIMVTLPKEAAEDKNIIPDLINAGMSAARINCAHDNIDVWYKIIDQISAVRKKTGRTCKICMDLGGPKLRTGKMIEGPRVIHVTPIRDVKGNVTEPCTLLLTDKELLPSEEYPIILPVNAEFLQAVKQKMTICFTDTRGKQRKFLVYKQTEFGFLVKINDSAYIETGTELTLYDGESEICKGNVGLLPPVEQYITLKPGDKLILLKENIEGKPAEYDDDGKVVSPAYISCTLPEFFKDVKKDELIVFDDGKIEGHIEEVYEDKLVIEIDYAKETGEKLKADKGINLPESNLSVSGLTDKDKEDLRFIVKNADVVNFSFVNCAKDVEDLFNELDKLERKNIGIILKIETRKAFNNLPEILFAAMKRQPIGVMIARGDLAIELGWKNLARAQEELLSLCEAVHIPVVWATQVLETHAKKGRPSRAEVTDAALSERAECVMLNKGPHIVKTVKLLNEILKDAEEYQDKKTTLLPELRMFNLIKK